MIRLVYEEDGQKKDYVVRARERVRVGRDAACEISTTDKSVSRHHLTLTPEGGQLRLRDDGGANGVFVNDKRVTEAIVKHGDVVRAGKFALTVQVEELGESTIVEPAAPLQESDATIIDPGFAGRSKAQAAAPTGPPPSLAEVSKLFAAGGQVLPAPAVPGAHAPAAHAPAAHAPSAAPPAVAPAPEPALGPGVPAPHIEIVLGLPPRSIPVATRKVTLGTGDDNGIALKVEGLSRHHTEIVFSEGAWVARDLGSKNGTYIDGKKVTQATLKGGEILALGPVKLRFVLPSAAPGAGRPPRPKALLVAGGLAGVLLLGAGLYLASSGGGGGSGGGGEVGPGPDVPKAEVCSNCNKPGHKRENCPRTRIVTEYSEVGVRLGRALEGRFKDTAKTAEAETALVRAYNTGGLIQKTYGEPPAEQGAVRTFLELLAIFRERAPLDYRDFKWKEPRERIAAIALDRNFHPSLRDIASHLLEWIEVESQANELLREGEDFFVNANPEEAYKTYKRMREDSVYAPAATQRRKEIKDALWEKRGREIRNKIDAHDYNGAARQIDDTLALLGEEFADVRSELLPRKAECDQYVGTQQAFADVEQAITKGDFDAARKRLDDIPSSMMRIDWVKKRSLELLDRIEAEAVMRNVLSKYNLGEAHAALTLISPQAVQLHSELAALRDRIQKVMRLADEMADAQKRNDRALAREKAQIILTAEPDPANAFRRKAQQLLDDDPEVVARTECLRGLELAREADGLENQAKTAFENEQLADGRKRVDDAVAKFTEARTLLERVRKTNTSLHRDAEKKVQEQIADAQRTWNTARNAEGWKPERRLGLLRIAVAKLLPSGEVREKALRGEIEAFIVKLELQLQGPK